jgi:hypothetical protein
MVSTYSSDPKFQGSKATNPSSSPSDLQLSLDNLSCGEAMT